MPLALDLSTSPNIAKASWDKLAISGTKKIDAYDQIENIGDLAMPADQNRRVTFVTGGKNPEISKPDVGGGALGGTRTPTILLTATSRQRVYQFRHERLGRPPRD